MVPEMVTSLRFSRDFVEAREAVRTLTKRTGKAVDSFGPAV